MMNVGQDIGSKGGNKPDNTHIPKGQGGGQEDLTQKGKNPIKGSGVPMELKQ